MAEMILSSSTIAKGRPTLACVTSPICALQRQTEIDFRIGLRVETDAGINQTFATDHGAATNDIRHLQLSIGVDKTASAGGRLPLTS